MDSPLARTIQLAYALCPKWFSFRHPPPPNSRQRTENPPISDQIVCLAANCQEASSQAPIADKMQQRNYLGSPSREVSDERGPFGGLQSLRTVLPYFDIPCCSQETCIKTVNVR